jgi:hypothetical protein
VPPAIGSRRLPEASAAPNLAVHPELPASALMVLDAADGPFRPRGESATGQAGNAFTGKLRLRIPMLGSLLFQDAADLSPKQDHNTHQVQPDHQHDQCLQ